MSEQEMAELMEAHREAEEAIKRMHVVSVLLGTTALAACLLWGVLCWAAM